MVLIPRVIFLLLHAATSTLMNEKIQCIASCVRYVKWKINNRPQFHFHFRLICIVNKLSRWMTWKLTLKIYGNSNECKMRMRMRQWDVFEWIIIEIGMKNWEKHEKRFVENFYDFFVNFQSRLLCVVCHTAYLYVSMS